MLKRHRFHHLAAALVIGAGLSFAHTAQAADAPAPELEATSKAVQAELEQMGFGMTPEKQKAMDAAMQQHMAGVAPEMEAMGATMAKSMNTPEMRASMDKVAKEMTGMMAKQVPVMMQAVQPMLSDMLPRMLRMQADMLQILFTPPAKDPKTK
jgi:hypothetical protein